MRNSRDASIAALASKYPNGLPSKVEYVNDPEAPIRFRMLLKKFSSWPRITRMVSNYIKMEASKAPEPQPEPQPESKVEQPKAEPVKKAPATKGK